MIGGREQAYQISGRRLFQEDGPPGYSVGSKGLGGQEPGDNGPGCCEDASSPLTEMEALPEGLSRRVAASDKQGVRGGDESRCWRTTQEVLQPSRPLNGLIWGDLGGGDGYRDLFTDWTWGRRKEGRTAGFLVGFSLPRWRGLWGEGLRWKIRGLDVDVLSLVCLVDFQV